MRDPLRPHKQAAPARRLLHPPPHPLQELNPPHVKLHPTSPAQAAASSSTWDLEVDERGVELGARVGVLEPARGVVVESVERAAERAGPAPPLQIAVAAEVGPAVLAARDAVAAGAGGRGLAALVGGGEGRHGDAPLDGTRLQRLQRGREAGDRRAHRHSRGRVGAAESPSFRLGSLGAAGVRTGDGDTTRRRRRGARDSSSRACCSLTGLGRGDGFLGFYAGLRDDLDRSFAIGRYVGV